MSDGTIDQHAGTQGKRMGDLGELDDADVERSPLHLAEVGAVQTGQGGQRLLAPAMLGPQHRAPAAEGVRQRGSLPGAGRDLGIWILHQAVRHLPLLLKSCRPYRRHG